MIAKHGPGNHRTTSHEYIFDAIKKREVFIFLERDYPGKIITWLFSIYFWWGGGGAMYVGRAKDEKQQLDRSCQK
jgi:5S rRNA maturation endonuclease (ribonuclease M5)